MDRDARPAEAVRIDVPARVRAILEKLQENGYEAYVVGGCVRDALLGREPKDWDITTSARPEQVKRLFRRTVDTGIAHGTVTVLMGRESFEVTTYRIDGSYSDGRHPDGVSFCASLPEDLKRRDFTMNAMAYSCSDGLVDLFGGIKDLAERRIRCVGDAAERFGEDALRMLRAVRFSAQLDFEIEGNTCEAIRTLSSGLARISKERIQAELTKILVSAHPGRIGLVFSLGLSPYLCASFPEVCYEPGQIPVSLPDGKALRWAAFLRGGDAAGAGRLLRELKMDKETIIRVKTLVEWAGRPFESEAVPRQVRFCISEIGWQAFEELLLLRGCLEKEGLVALDGAEYSVLKDAAETIRAAGECTSLNELAIRGQDLIDEGIKPGREMGRLLNWLFTRVLEDPSLNTKEALLGELKKTIPCFQDGKSDE